MKVLKIILIILAILFVSMLSIPVIFKSKIMELAKVEVNKAVKAEVDWTDFKISLFKGFPDLKISMENMSVLGIDMFESDTLMAFDEFSVKVDLFSAFSGKINVKSIILDKPVIRAISLEDGVNWDIAYPSDEIEEVEEDTTSGSMTMTLSLKEFLIKDADISYYDEPTSTFATIEDFNLSLEGNFSETITDLTLNTFAEAITVEYDGVKYLNNSYFSFNSVLNADLENMKFEILENLLEINDLALGLEGIVGLPENADADVDIRFFTKETSFKTLLSMVPAIYMQDFSELKTSGSLKIEGTAKGLVVGDILPRVELNLMVNDAYFAYPDLPESVDNINIDLNVFYDGVEDDNTRIDLNKFHLELAGNPVDMNFHVRTPMSDMQMTGVIDANINLGSLKNALPLENMELEGTIISNIEMMGKMSDIENENYEAFKADGRLEIIGMTLKGEDIPVPIKLEKTTLLFSPKYVNLETFDAKLGESDIHLDGKLENFIPYVFENKILKGELNFSSTFLSLNELMGSVVEEEEVEIEDTTLLSVVEVPSNIDFELQTNLGEVLYDNLKINDILGVLWVKNGIVRMDMLKMNLLDGSMLLNGEYNTLDITTPMIKMNMDMEDIDIQKAAVSFNSIEKLMPVAEMCHGDISMKLDFVSALDSTMNPDLNSILGEGSLHTDEIKLEDNETFTKIGNLLKKPDLAEQKFKDVNISFEIIDGRVFVKPFDTDLGTTKLTVGGSQGLDQSLDYDLDFSIPRSQFGSASNDILENFSAQAKAKGFELDPGENVNMGVNMTGTFTDPKISMDLKESISGTKTQVKEAVKEKVEVEVEKVKEEVRENVSAEVDKIMADAAVEAEKLRQSGKDAGIALIGEAKLRKKQLVKEAGSNPFKKIAAEKTGDALIKTAKKQAVKLEAEANEKANKLMAAAQKKADNIKSK